MGPLQVSFSLRVKAPTKLLIYAGVCFGVCFLLSCAILDVIFTNGAQLFGFASLLPFRTYLGQANVHPGDGHLPMPGMH